MEYASGGELTEYIKQHDGVNETYAQAIIKQISAAVYYCHQKGIIHRDLKPQNVMFMNSDYDDPMMRQIKVVDFGISGYCKNNQAETTDAGT